MPVGDTDVAPHFRVAAGDPGEITKAARRIAEKLFSVGTPGEIMDQTESQQVRQMAYRCKHPVMLLRAHFVKHGATGRPQFTHPGDRGRIVFGKRCDHHLAALVKIGPGGRRPAFLGAGNRMRRYDIRELRTEVTINRFNHVALGTARIGDDGVRAEMGSYRRRHRIHLTDRHGEKNKLGTIEGAGPVGGNLVDHAKLQG